MIHNNYILSINNSTVENRNEIGYFFTEIRISNFNFLIGVISGTVIFLVNDLFPTTTVLFMFPYASTVAFTLNTTLSPASKSTIHVMVLVTSSYLLRYGLH